MSCNIQAHKHKDKHKDRHTHTIFVFIYYHYYVRTWFVFPWGKCEHSTKQPYETKSKKKKSILRLCDHFITIVENRPTIVYVHLSCVCNIGTLCPFIVVHSCLLFSSAHHHHHHHISELKNLPGTHAFLSILFHCKSQFTVNTTGCHFCNSTQRTVQCVTTEMNI